MHCTKCGAELAEDAKFCASCGAVVEAPAVVETEAAPVETVIPVQTDAPETEKTEGFKIDVNAVKEQLIETVTPIVNVIKALFSKKAVRFGVLGGAALLIVLGLIGGLLFSGNGFVNVKQHTKLQEVDGTLSIIIDGKLQKKTIELGYQETRDGDLEKEYRDWSTGRSIDGKVTAVHVYGTVYESEDSWYSYTAGDLYVINGKKLQKVAEDVYDFEVSINGKGIVYLVRNERDEDTSYNTYTMYLYNVSTKKSTTVSDEVATTTYALAPNGKSVAYYEAGKTNDEGEREYTLMYSTGKKSQKVTSQEGTLMGMSNNGKQIYVIRSNDEDTEYNLYSYNAKGNSTKLGQIGSSYGSGMVFNKDRTQVLFTNDNKTYISTNGKEAIKAFNGSVSLLTPSTASSYCYRVKPVSNLYGQVYATNNSEGGANVYIIKKNSDKNAKLASKVSSPQLDESGDYLYYLYDGDELRLTKVSYGDKATEKYTVLADDVDGFVATPNRKYVYFLSDDTLYSTNGKKGGKKTIVCSDEVEDVDMTPEGRLYYIVEGDLYTTNNGKKGQKILSDVDSVTCTATGVIYAQGEDTLYVSTGAKKLKKLMDLG